MGTICGNRGGNSKVHLRGYWSGQGPHTGGSKRTEKHEDCDKV